MATQFKTEIVPLAEVPKADSHCGFEIYRPVVLVVDDERLVADSLTAILSRSGFAAFAAYSGETALAFADVIHPELLITDIAMPGMNGVELALSMAHLVPDCRILLFSGHATQKDLTIAHQAGYNFPLLTKPVHPVDLLRHIRTSLGANDSRREMSETPTRWPVAQLSSAD